jgi:hypothetical protein
MYVDNGQLGQSMTSMDEIIQAETGKAMSIQRAMEIVNHFNKPIPSTSVEVKTMQEMGMTADDRDSAKSILAKIMARKPVVDHSKPKTATQVNDENAKVLIDKMRAGQPVISDWGFEQGPYGYSIGVVPPDQTYTVTATMPVEVGSYRVMNDLVGLGFDNTKLTTVNNHGSLTSATLTGTLNVPCGSHVNTLPAPSTVYGWNDPLSCTSYSAVATKDEMINHIDEYMSSVVNAKINSLEEQIRQLNERQKAMKGQIDALKYENSVLTYRVSTMASHNED